MSDLTITTDPATTYQVVAVAEPAAIGWLHLPSIHAKLLPLAQAAGHETLWLTCECFGAGASEYNYLASASGGHAGFRRYISMLEPGGGYSWHDFERILTEKLQQQAAYLQAVKGGQQDA